MNYINAEVIKGVLIPFAGTVLGSASVFLLKNAMNERIQKALTGFAAGVMVAASIWSLIIPAIERVRVDGKTGFCTGVCRNMGRNTFSAFAGPYNPTSAYVQR